MARRWFSCTADQGDLSPRLRASSRLTFRVLEPIQRHHGGPTLTVDQHIRDLAVVAPDNMLLVGWSWGAMLALSFTARYPKRVRSLVLIGCGTYDTSTRMAYDREIDARLGSKGCSEVESLKKRLVIEVDPVTRNRLFSHMANLITRAQSVDPIAHVMAEVSVDGYGHAETWNDALKLQEEGVEPEAFSAITIPVLMLQGSDDPHPGPATRDLLRRYIPHLEYWACPDLVDSFPMLPQQRNL